MFDNNKGQFSLVIIIIGVIIALIVGAFLFFNLYKFVGILFILYALYEEVFQREKMKERKSQMWINGIIALVGVILLFLH